MNPQTSKTVLVVGAGPVGATMALELARRNVRSIVLERRDGLAPNPKCITTNARSMEFFRKLGLAGRIRAAGMPDDHATDVVYMTSLTGHELTRYVLPSRKELTHGGIVAIDAGWPTPEPQHRISQIYLEPILHEELYKSDLIDFRNGFELVSFEQTPDGVISTVRDAEGETQQIRTDYLVGADGANSIVRRAIGARLQGIPEVARLVTVFVRAPHIRQLVENRRPGFMYRLLGKGAPISMASIDGRDLWIFHIVVPPTTDPATFDHTTAMYDGVGEEFKFDTLNREVWIGRAMVADKFRDRRVFLAGDAAHIWIPMGGFGMNAGIADSIGLAWLLQGALEGWLNEDALDSYAVERASVGGLIAGQAARINSDLTALYNVPGGLETLDDETADAANRRAELGAKIRQANLAEFNSVGMQLGYEYSDSPVIVYDGSPAPQFAIDHYEESSRPGVRAPHVWVADGVSLHDQFGAGFTLLQVGTDVTANEVVNAAAQRDIPLTTVNVSQPEAVEKYGTCYVLVRPDQHIAWRSVVAPDASEAHGIWDRLTGNAEGEPAVPVLEAEEVASGFLFGEGLRWKDGRLVFSDMIGQRVLEFDPASNELKTLHTLDDRPNGLGFLPDGRLIITAMKSGLLYVADDNGLEVYADLSHLLTGYLGDLTVDSAGRIYVDDTGARVLEGEAPAAGRLILVDTDRQARVVVENLLFPNGLVLSQDEKHLYLVESFALRMQRISVESDGSLGQPEPFVDLSPGTGDGIASTRDGGTWVCGPMFSKVVTRYDSEGNVTAVVRHDAWEPIACAVGGEDNKTLYIVGTDELPEGKDHFKAMDAGETVGRLWQVPLPDHL